MSLAILLTVVGCGDSGDSSDTDCVFGEYYSYSESRCVKSYTYPTTYTWDENSADKYKSAESSSEPIQTLEHQTLEHQTVVASPKAVSFSIANPECRLKKLSFFDSGAGFTAVYTADCLEGEQLYLREISYDGTVAKPQRLISTECYDYYSEVTTFKAVASQVAVLLAYQCSKSGGVLMAIDFTGQTLQKSSVSLGSSDPLLMWHDGLSVFSLLTGNTLRTYSPSGRFTGRTIDLTSLGTVRGMIQSEGGWMIHSSGSVYSTCYYNCGSSKILMTKMNHDGSMPNKLVEVPYFPNAMMSASRAVAVADSQLKIASYNSKTLALAPLQKLGDQSIYRSNLRFFSFHKASDQLGVSLIGSYDGIFLEMFTDALSSALVSSKIVLDGGYVGTPSFQVVGNQFYVGYIEPNGRGTMVTLQP
jgi:hypothetical protein